MRTGISSFKRVLRKDWPRDDNQNRIDVFISKKMGFLVQVFLESGVTRLSVSRTERQSDGRWKEGITWDELQSVKRGIGFGDRWAVEVFPADMSIVNVANMRHLFVLDGPPPFAWASDGSANEQRGPG